MDLLDSLFKEGINKIEDFKAEIENVHMVWLEEIKEEAKRLLDSNEPELMPKTPSQKKNKKRRSSRGKRQKIQNLFDQSLESIAEAEPTIPRKRTTRAATKAAHSKPAYDVEPLPERLIEPAPAMDTSPAEAEVPSFGVAYGDVDMDLEPSTSPKVSLGSDVSVLVSPPFTPVTPVSTL